MASGENNYHVLDKLQDAIQKGQSPMTIFPTPLSDPVIITIPDPTDGISGSGTKYKYDSFPANCRTEEQEAKKNQILQLIKERDDELKGMILAIKVKVQRLWLSLLKLGLDEAILSSYEYETILALIETDSKGIVASAFVECIRDYINTGWTCQLSEEQFIAVKELMKAVITRATYQNDMPTLKEALEVSAEMYRKDVNNVSDYIQRHLSLSVWEDAGFWERLFNFMLEQSSDKSSKNESIVMSQLIMVVSHMADLGISGTDAWSIIEGIAQRNNVEYEYYMQLREYMSYIHQVHMAYWGISDLKAQSLSSYGLESPSLPNGTDLSQQPSKASAVARNWVKSMFGKEADLKLNSFNRGYWTTESEAASETGTPRKHSLPNIGQRKIPPNMRLLKGHSGAITALHCVTRKEVWDLVGDREDAGYFISGSTDCSVKIWDPSSRGSELKATLRGHTGVIRAISSDGWKVVSGSDDMSILVWDKREFFLLEELKGHTASISSVRMLSGDRILSSSHDGTVKMWDARSGSCIATIAHSSAAVLCMEYNDTTGILAAAGRDSNLNIWDVRVNKQMHKLSGHRKWLRSIRMVGDTVVTGSDDWTARVWSVSRGVCEAVLTCHGGPVRSVEHSVSDNQIFTGSDDGLVKFWENDFGTLKCVKDVTMHSPVLSITAGEQWLGLGTADNSMSLFHLSREKFSGLSDVGSRTDGWQLYRAPQTSAAVIRCVASDLERKRICSGGRDGILRLWDATISI